MTFNRAIFGRKLFWMTAALLLVVLAGMFTAYRLSPSAGEAAEDTATGTWVGSTHTKLNRSHKLLSAGYTQRGDFRFTVDDNGKVKGHATVFYEPTSDPAGINAAIGFVKTATSSMLGLVPFTGPWKAIPGLGSQALATIIGVKVNFDDPLPVRSGPITGTLHQGRLSIDWATGPDTVKLPSKTVLSFLGDKKDEVITTASLITKDPWPGTATLGKGDAKWQATHTHSEESKGEVKETWANFWEARRVSDGS